MSETQNENLRVIGGILRRKDEEIRRLQEENAKLRGIRTEAQKQQDREDAEVFRLLHSRPSMSEGCIRVVIGL